MTSFSRGSRPWPQGRCSDGTGLPPESGDDGAFVVVHQCRKTNSLLFALAAAIIMPLSFVAGALWYTATYGTPQEVGRIGGDQPGPATKEFRSQPPLDPVLP